ncbi:MAG: protein kinase [Pseudomonadota bacterium]
MFVVASRYEFCTTPLGTGAFSHVYGGRDQETGKSVALKVDTSAYRAGARRRAMVIFEATVLRDLHRENQVQGVPRVYWSGTAPIEPLGEALPAMVIDHLPCSLGQWMDQRRRDGHRLSRCQATLLTAELVHIVRSIHQRGYLHRDIKPENIMIGDDSHLYLIDFGLSKKYLQGGRHIPYIDQKGSMVGTPRYCATHTHERVESSRRDDLQAVFFVFLYLLFQRLPWQSSRRQRYQERQVLRMKREFLLGSSPTDARYDQWLRRLPREFFQVTRYVYDLSFEAVPDYERIVRDLLRAFSARRTDRRPGAPEPISHAASSGSSVTDPPN